MASGCPLTVYPCKGISNFFLSLNKETGKQNFAVGILRPGFTNVCKVFILLILSSDTVAEVYNTYNDCVLSFRSLNS